MIVIPSCDLGLIAVMQTRESIPDRQSELDFAPEDGFQGQIHLEVP